MEKYRITITNEILNLISEIDEFKGKWRALNTLSPDRLRMLKKSATIESIASSTRIEGVKLTDIEVETLLSNLNKTLFKSRDEEEVVGYSDAMDLIYESFEELELTENHIKQLHHILLQHSSKDVRHRGEYKKLDNHVVAFDSNGKEVGVVFKTATPFETPMQMKDLVGWANHEFESKNTHHLLVIAIFIVIFLAIHPFQDGNGRLSRILTNLLLLKNGYSYITYSSLESIIEDNKDLYYKNLRSCQVTLESENIKYENWIVFFLKSLKKQKDNLERKVKNERILLDKLGNTHLQILQILKGHDRLSVSEIQELSGIKRGTLKVKLEELVNLGKIEIYGKGRGTSYGIISA